MDFSQRLINSGMEENSFFSGGVKKSIVTEINAPKDESRIKCNLFL